MRLTDLLLIAVGCLGAYGFIDPDGAAELLRQVTNTATAIWRG